MSEFDDRTFRLMAQNDDDSDKASGARMLGIVMILSTVFWVGVGLAWYF